MAMGSHMMFCAPPTRLSHQLNQICKRGTHQPYGRWLALLLGEIMVSERSEERLELNEKKKERKGKKEEEREKKRREEEGEEGERRESG